MKGAYQMPAMSHYQSPATVTNGMMMPKGICTQRVPNNASGVQNT